MTSIRRFGIPDRSFPWALTRRLLLLTILLVAFDLRINLAESRPRAGDEARYMALADSLLAGRGYEYRGLPNTSMAPGYPAFLALVRGLHDSDALVLGVQVAAGVLSCWLVYLAVAPTSAGLGLLAAATMACNPWLARQSAFILSEVLATLLVAALAWAAARMERDRGTSWGYPLVGLLAAGMMLTAPATAFLAAAAVVWAAVLSRARALPLALLLLGVGLPLGAWQARTFALRGEIPWTLYTTEHYRTLDPENGFFAWLRTWSTSSYDHELAAFRTWQVEEYPDRAFATGISRERYAEMAAGAWHNRVLEARHHDELLEASRTFRRRHPIRYYVTLPSMRSAAAWLDPWSPTRHLHRDLAAVVATRSWPEAITEIVRSRRLLAATLFFSLQICNLLVIAACLAAGLLRRSGFALAVLLAVVAFSAAVDLGGLEVRRTYVFYPVLLSCLRYLEPLVRRLRSDPPAPLGPPGDIGCVAAAASTAAS